MVSQWQNPANQSALVSHAKPMNHDGLDGDSTRNEWLQVDLLEFLATTIDLRIVLFQAQDPSILAS